MKKTIYEMCNRKRDHRVGGMAMKIRMIWVVLCMNMVLPAVGDDTTPSPASVKWLLSCPKESVAGVPLWVAITIQNETSEDMYYGPSVESRPFRGLDYHWEMRNITDGKIVAERTVCAPSEFGLYYPPKRWPEHEIPSGKSLRLLFPLYDSDSVPECQRAGKTGQWWAVENRPVWGGL